MKCSLGAPALLWAVVLLVFARSTKAATCQQHCSCTGRMIVCSGLFTFPLMPAFFQPQHTNLTIHDTQITVVGHDTFAAGGATLQWLSLSQNRRLTKLESGAFRGLPDLRTLYLGYNALTMLPSDVFAGNPMLETVDLSDNPITSLPANLFSSQTRLQFFNFPQSNPLPLPLNLFANVAQLSKVVTNSSAWLTRCTVAAASVPIYGIVGPSDLLLHVRRVRGECGPARVACTLRNATVKHYCVCPGNYAFNGVSCPRDECTEKTHSCSPNAHCQDTASSYTCQCWPGYHGNGAACTDNDECGSATHNCQPATQTCVNAPGSYTCICRAGFGGSPCADENECEDGTRCHSNAMCTNTVGSYTCKCDQGFTGNGHQCTDIADTVPRYGFIRDGNGWQDINECGSDIHNCNSSALCTNAIGSYTCIELSDFTCRRPGAAVTGDQEVAKFFLVGVCGLLVLASVGLIALVSRHRRNTGNGDRKRRKQELFPPWMRRLSSIGSSGANFNEVRIAEKALVQGKEDGALADGVFPKDYQLIRTTRSKSIANSPMVHSDQNQVDTTSVKTGRSSYYPQVPEFSTDGRRMTTGNWITRSNYHSRASLHFEANPLESIEKEFRFGNKLYNTPRQAGRRSGSPHVKPKAAEERLPQYSTSTKQHYSSKKVRNSYDSYDHFDTKSPLREMFSTSSEMSLLDCGPKQHVHPTASLLSSKLSTGKISEHQPADDGLYADSTWTPELGYGSGSNIAQQCEDVSHYQPVETRDCEESPSGYLRVKTRQSSSTYSTPQMRHSDRLFKRTDSTPIMRSLEHLDTMEASTDTDLYNSAYGKSPNATVYQELPDGPKSTEHLTAEGELTVKSSVE